MFSVMKDFVMPEVKMNRFFSFEEFFACEVVS